MKKNAVLFLSFSLAAVSSFAQNSIAGFSKAAAEAESATEKKFDANLSAKNVDDYIKQLSAMPHHVSSPGGDANVKFITDKFKSWGFDTEVETFYVLFPTPVTRELSMSGTKAFKASLKEPMLKEDATSGQSGQLPVYNCW